jgi:hypothetical protein
MKNQYFGDVNDYRKYGLLRILSGGGELSTGVRWMLTPSDGRGDGAFVRYLEQPRRWRAFDQDLYDFLVHCVHEGNERDVRLIERSELLPASLFHSCLLDDSPIERRRYFQEMLERFRGVDLIFFDPDNGFEVKSKPYGRKESSKFLYWREVYDAYYAGHSLLVYQHFARERRDTFVERIANELLSCTNVAAIYSFRTPHVVFFLAARPEHEEMFHRQAARIALVWQG